MSITATNDNLLTTEEIEAVKKLYESKRNILSYLNMDEFINKVSDLIDQSDTFSFRSSTSKYTINKVRPVFVMKIIDEKLLNQMLEIEKTDDTGEMKTLDALTVVLNEKIIKEISKILTDQFSEHDEELFVDVPESLKKFIISSIFSIRFSVKDNNIQLMCFF